MPILLDDTFHYTIANREFYEPLDRYRPMEADFLAIAVRHLPTTWRIMRHGIWFSSLPPDADAPEQGWKIHVSATTANAASVLATVARELGARGVPFKFALDNFIFRLLNGKNWPRGGSGKFITVYPRNEENCRDMLDLLRRALIGYSGPYILSDRRFADSKNVHYRYGGIAPTTRLHVSGENRHVIKAVAGEVIDDDRTPYFNLPAGVADPFQPVTEEAEPGSAGEPLLNGGRYRIESAIAFSNSGGVYLGKEEATGRKIIIKEARPFTSQNQVGADAVSLLKKEYRLLSLLQDLRIAPEPIDFFQEWEHYYLVEEFIEGQILRGYNGKWALALNVAPTSEDAAEYMRRYRRLYTRIAEVVAALHDRNVVFSDLSHHNVIVQDDGNDIKLIDFEGAYEQGVESPSLLYTPGFAPKEVYQDGSSERSDDCYGLGGLMLAGIWPINSIMALDARASEPFLASAVRDLAFPVEIAEVIKGLLVPEREARQVGLSDVVRVLAQETPLAAPFISCAEVDSTDLPTSVDKMLSYIDAVCDYSRDDRLYPSAPLAFQTNPLSFAYGACGVVHTLWRVRGETDPRALDWLARHPIDPRVVPPGLAVGSAGIAWALLDMGAHDLAELAIRATEDHPLRFGSPDLFHGAAGWGMAQLRFLLGTGREHHREKARAAGDFLLQTAEVTEDGPLWRKDNVEHAGLGHGGAGIALFLLYLSLATDDPKYMDVGRAAMERVLSRAVTTPVGGLTWRVQEGHPTITPYWRWGSAGVGIAALRYNQACTDRPFGVALEQILLDTDRKYSIFSGQHLGLAGIAEFLLDLVQWGVEEERARAAAKKVLSGVLLFQVDRPEGIAFPGECRTRITCDYATGSAGIASVFHRYLTGAPPVLMLDELLRSNSPVNSPLSVCRPEAAYQVTA